MVLGFGVSTKNKEPGIAPDSLSIKLSINTLQIIVL